jgi:hypothetical protein
MLETKFGNSVLFFLLFVPIVLVGQQDSCTQFEKAISYLKSDTTFLSCYSGVKLRFEVSDEVGSGGLYPFMIHEYVAWKLGLENQDELQTLDTSLVYPLVREAEREDLSNRPSNILSCLSEMGTKRNPKIYLSFSRMREDNVLLVFSSRIYKRPRHTFGMIHLFIFNKSDDILKVFDTRWIE